VDGTISDLGVDMARQGALVGYTVPRLELKEGVDVDLTSKKKLSDSVDSFGFSNEGHYSLIESVITITAEEIPFIRMSSVPPPKRRRRIARSPDNTSR